MDQVRKESDASGPSLDLNGRGGTHQVLAFEDVLDPHTILAYEINWNPLSIPHGAPCRLRIEIKTGYRMVKYLCAIEVVDGFAKIGKGYGGYREDHQYEDKVAAI
jgi:sulfoxide reductase catalytic subunit YedY